ncbi:uncharacterized protein LOC127869135 [Dreissena polymorpha]|nr:uncharacterized protein LOC127869135 [Dreissena polymorpha]
MLFDSYMLLTRVSSRLFFIGGYVGERTDNEVQLFCWDTEQKIEPFELCDREAVKIVMANVYRLDDDRIMTTGKGDNYDFRVSTPCTGAPMERFSTQPAITSGNTRLLTSSRGLFTMETNLHRRLGLNAVFPYIQPKPTCLVLRSTLLNTSKRATNRKWEIPTRAMRYLIIESQSNDEGDAMRCENNHYIEHTQC